MKRSRVIWPTRTVFARWMILTTIYIVASGLEFKTANSMKQVLHALSPTFTLHHTSVALSSCMFHVTRHTHGTLQHLSECYVIRLCSLSLNRTLTAYMLQWRRGKYEHKQKSASVLSYAEHTIQCTIHRCFILSSKWRMTCHSAFYRNLQHLCGYMWPFHLKSSFVYRKSQEEFCQNDNNFVEIEIIFI